MLNNQIKVLHVGADNIGHGGRSTIAYNLAINMDSNKIHNDFLAFKKIDYEYEKKIKLLGGNVKRIENHGNNKIIRKINTAKDSISIIRKNKYDIIHVHADTATEAVKNILIAKLAGTQNVFIHAHTSGSLKKRSIISNFIGKICQNIIRNNRYVKIACTKNAAEFMYGQESDSINIINNGVSVDRYHYDIQLRDVKRNKMKLSNNFVIGCVARLVPVKNHSFLVNIFKEIKKKAPNAKLLLIGDGPLKKDIEKQIQQYGLQDDISFLGNRKDVSDLLQVMDVFVLPSVYEGLGLVNIEAQSAGLPCIVSDGIPDEAKILKSFNFLKLSESPKIWADTILSYKSFSRIDTSKYIKDAGYDIISSAEAIQNLYKKNVKK